MEMTLEVVTVPVTDLDRAKTFYGEALGFKVDLDDEVAPGMRIVQLTPPGSRCSIALMTGMPRHPDQPEMAPGSLHALQLCVTDIAKAHSELMSRGVPVTPIQHVGATGWEDGPGDVWNAFMFFKDPDGNTWCVQEAPSPLSER
ncbi:VOC family protein [Streptomyces sp. NPDC002867]|uniref:VOC family protein n=1 Tax=Streptomyces sp. V4I23 TaxID=3042282 RepID=UPI00277F5A83|nr:VOC family protein [Streptomyces sp. V4I23]MDQ1011185.1 catechol 2,3-dioxygenase-like lactoylglutathione lyase family enzyme [Streptomyces sp. V4I23]